MPKDIYLKFMLASQEVVKILEKGLNAKRVAMVMEGMEINHAHIKLYPLYGLNEKFQEMLAKDKIFFEKYEGFISTLSGPEVKLEEIKDLANKIRKHIK